MSPEQPAIITISGKNIALGPIRQDLIPLYQKWMNQLDTTRFLRMGIYSHENEEAWYEDIARGSDKAYFTIYERLSMQAIGGVELHGIDLANRTAELGIMIGEPGARGKGYGTEAVQLMCDFGFHALGLHSITLVTSEWNIAGQKAYLKAGFREVGRRRQALWFAGRYWDQILYDLLSSEFRSPVVQEIILRGIEDPKTSNGADQ